MNPAEIVAMNDDELRSTVAAWLQDNWDPKVRAPSTWETPSPEYIAWLHKLLDARWMVPRWPVAWYGLDMSDARARIVEGEFRKVGAQGSGQDRTNLAANTLLTFGTDSLKRELLPRLLCAQASICLLYSEPGAGSDLAAIRTRADRDGDNWIISGQKVWVSGAATADYGLLLARTDWDVPKHKGVSFFFCPMKQPGIEVRPLHQITDESHFNEVFIDNAVVPAANLLGELNTGWRVMQTALAYERSIMGEGAGDRKTSKRGADKDLISLAREKGALQDPVMRQDIARVMAYRKLNDLNMARAKADAKQGGASPLMSLGKLAMSRILHEEARVRTAVLGAESMLDGDNFADAHDTNFRAFIAYMTSIGGGTDQIQRNIIGERVLGLPREPELDRDVPFRSVKSG
jgi:alkylation response protein AidB-like acyl-CoA dehydrogenase